MKAALREFVPRDKWTIYGFMQSFFSSSPIILTNLTYLSLGVCVARAAGLQVSSPAIIIIIKKIHNRDVGLPPLSFITSQRD